MQNSRDIKFNDLFNSKHLELKKKTARSAAFVLFGRACVYSLSFLAMIILARLIKPEDFGLVNMASVVIFFLGLIGDLGLATVTVQKNTISHDLVTSLFWINVSINSFCCILCAIISPYVAWFYSDLRLTSITLILGTVFFINGLGVQHLALLKRQMRFGIVVGIEILATALSLIAGVYCAFIGLGYWALVVKQLSLPLFQTIGTWLFCPFKPGLPSKHYELKSVLSFGGTLTISNIIIQAARKLDTILIGKKFGAEHVGIYSKGFSFIVMPIRQINRPLSSVVMSTLSRLWGDDEKYRLAYIRIMEKIAIITMPTIAILIASSDWVINILLGKQWIAVIPLFRIFGFLALLEPISISIGWLLITQGRSKDYFTWSIISATIAVTAVLIGVQWGIKGVAVSLTIAGIFIRQPLGFWFVSLNSPIKFRDFYYISIFYGGISIGLLLFLVNIRLFFMIENPIIGIGIIFFFGLVFIFAILFLLPSGKKALMDFRDILKIIISSKIN
ncbi:MAG: lipopolysaccharide biosynthesis protein [Desulfobacterales bacterium]|nr:lipopolysaccharide biosynthesis protein [Desulfobacterales bacterium]